MNNINKTNKEAWNAHASRYFEENKLTVHQVDYCGQYYPNEDDLQLIGDVKGLKILEIGAGSCNVGIALALKGADVTCIDISEEQIKLGEKVAQENGVHIKTLVMDMEELDGLESNSYDIVISVCALMYIENLNKVFKDISKLLKKNGKFIFSVDHPMMQALGAKELWPEENASWSYNYSGKVEWKWMSEDSFKFTTYRRPIMEYVNALAKNGLFIDHMHEAYPVKCDCEWSDTEILLRNRFPSILICRVLKLV